MLGGFTSQERILLRRLLSRIRENLLMPGLTLTERAKGALPGEVLDGEAARTPTGRLTAPEEVATLVVFLGSAANGHVNGENVRVTGGL